MNWNFVSSVDKSYLAFVKGMPTCPVNCFKLVCVKLVVLSCPDPEVSKQKKKNPKLNPNK